MKNTGQLSLILIIDDLQSFAGTEYVFFQQAKDLKAMSINVTVLSALGISEFWEERFLSIGIELKSLNNARNSTTDFFSQLKTIVDSSEIRVLIHIHALSDAARYISSRREELKCPVVISDNSFGGQNEYWYGKDLLSMVNNFDALIVLRDAIAENYINMGLNIPVIVKPNKIELPISYKYRKNVSINEFAFCGRISIEKGWHIILLSVYQLKDLDFKVHFYGDGTEKEDLKNYSKMLGINDKIIVHEPYYPFTGIDEVCSNNYCFIFPSFIEGFPITPLEVLLRGKKIILSDIPGHRGISSKYLNTLFYFNVGDPIDLAEKMRHMILKKTRYNEKPFLEKKFIKKLSDINCLIKLYRKLLHYE